MMERTYVTCLESEIARQKTGCWLVISDSRIQVLRYYTTAHILPYTTAQISTYTTAQISTYTNA